VFQPREGTLVNQWAADHTHAVAGGVPILALDMYEHAYHMDFGAAAGAYVDAFMNNINWAAVYERYQSAVHAASEPFGAGQDELGDALLLDVRRAGVFEKARTMIPGDSTNQWTSPDDPRVTTFGRLLRATHLDELPQAWNILRGELALVGPRPEQPHYVEELSATIPFYTTRHLVTPGLTGWAQVNYPYGSNHKDAYEKLQYEFWYLRHQQLSLDLKIIARTVRHVFGFQGR